MNKPLRVLLVEDSEDDALLVLRALKRGGYDPEYEQVQSAETMRTALRERAWDMILCDYRMPQFNGLEAIALLKESGIDIPLIIVSGAIGEETAVNCMRFGAHDYVMKGNLTRLVPAIERELKEAESRVQRKRVEEALRRSEENFRHSLDNSPMGLRIVTIEGETIYANRAILDIYGYDSIEELRTTPIQKRYTPASHAEFQIRREKRRQNADVPSEYTINIIRKDGEVRYLRVLRREILWDGERQFQVLYNDTTESKKAEELLRESETRYRQLVEYAPAAIYEADLTTGRLLSVNEVLCEYSGYTRDELLALHPLDLMTGESKKLILQRMAGYAAGEPVPPAVEYKARSKSGREFWISTHAKYFYQAGLPVRATVVAYDITERKQTEEELRTSRSQLRALATRLQQIREEERVLIAREIHDEMGGGLTGLKMDLSWLLHRVGDADSVEARAALTDKIHTANALIDQMIQVVRRISTELRPSVLDDLGLIAALEWQLSEFTSRTDIPHEFATTFEYVNLEEDAAVAVFRIFQEALTNVARHSRATKVVVVLREDERSLFGDESLVLEIRDNGRGITAEQILNTESLGLLGMKERALAFGGEISIHGKPGCGTALVLKIPRKQGELP